MQRGTIGPGELRPAEILRLPDGRMRVTHWRVVSKGRKAATDMFAAMGTADTSPTTSAEGSAANVRLVDERIDLLEGRPALVQVYEEIHASAETQVGLAKQIRLEDGRSAYEYLYLQFSTGTYTPGTVGTSTAPDSGSLYLQREEMEDDGTLRRIRRIYVGAGTLQQTDETRNNGKLLLRTIVSAKTVPATPSGYTLIREASNPVNGFPVYTYTFAKGDGEISRRTEYSQSGTTVDGTLGVTILRIEYLTAPGAAEPTWSGVSGYAKITVDNAERDGHEIWSAVYAKGAGLVAQLIHARQDGLREVTNICLGTRTAPSGIVVRDDYELRNGYTVYTVSAMQTAAGSGTVSGHSFSFERYVPFTYPGRAKAFEESYNSRYMLDVFRSPPVTTDVKATITVSYTTTNTIGTVSDYWNPTMWATLRAQWVGLSNEPANLVQELPGYRSVSETPVSRTASGSAPNNVSIFGNIVYGGSQAKITVTGGPSDPGGSTWTLDVTLEPAFIATDGTAYYRKTVVSAAIPTQSALPV